jgi:hypothetical protein
VQGSEHKSNLHLIEKKMISRNIAALFSCENDHHINVIILWQMLVVSWALAMIMVWSVILRCFCGSKNREDGQKKETLAKMNSYFDHHSINNHHC